MESNEDSSDSVSLPTNEDNDADYEPHSIPIAKKIKKNRKSKTFVNGITNVAESHSIRKSKTGSEVANENSRDAEEEILSNPDKEVAEYNKDVMQEQLTKSSSAQSININADTKVSLKQLIVPVRVSLPKILPAKIKDNKMLMVQLVDENGKLPKSKDINKTAPFVANEEISEQSISSKSSECSEEKSLTSSLRTPRSSTPMSREFNALQRSVTESKILTGFVADAAAIKARKRRKSITANKKRFLEYRSTKRFNINHYNRLKKRRKSSASGFYRVVRDGSSDSVKSEFHLNSSELWSADDKHGKRTNMRSQNTEFVQKQMHFLQRVNHQPRDENDISDIEFEQYNDIYDDDDSCIPDSAMESNSSINGSGPTSSEVQIVTEYVLHEKLNDASRLEKHLKSIWRPPPKVGWDSFCWKCRECDNLIPCNKCVRSFHLPCIKLNTSLKVDSNWICPECTNVENILHGPRRSRRSEMPMELLNQLLSFGLKRMKNVKGYSKFAIPSEKVSLDSKYIVKRVTFGTLQDKIDKKVFRCAEEFLNETKWMLHNALILFRANSKEALTAKGILKICRQEVNEIETCPECYLNANTRSDWFVDVCAQPHLLLWAKLKGFPYWPAKAMGLGQGSLVNVRFFGEHDRAFVPVKDCFLYSEQDPNTQTGKRSARELADASTEVEVHIANIKAKIGKFRYAAYRTQYDPAEELQQLEQMMPGVTEYMKKQQSLLPKPPLQYKIVKTADNHLLFKKADASESGPESDHAPNPNKKKSGEIIETDVNKAKYEVVSKAISDDSNSSKVSAVILKRKPNDTDRQESSEPEVPILKVAKIEENVEHPKLLINANKRKHRSDSISKDQDKQKTKHEPKVPIITIKTNGTKEIVNAKKAKADVENETQAVVENIVKNKQNVTSKRFSNEEQSTSSSNADTTNDTKDLTESSKDNSTFSNDSNASEVPKSETGNAKSVHKDETRTLTELVPFIEIKKEIVSDNEDCEKSEVNKSKSTEEAPQTSNPTMNEGTSSIVIKQEPISDDELELLEASNAKAFHNQHNREDQSSSSSDMRKVGDTSIQKLQTKHTKSAQQQNSQSVSLTSNASSENASSIVSNSNNKRWNSRGVPYGPLPAAASGINNSETDCTILLTDFTNSAPPQLELLQTRQSQRARKTFPNRAMCEISTASSNLVISSVTTQATSLLPSIESVRHEPLVSLRTDPQRSLLKTSMVAIPMDVATNRNVSSIPVPPLTAVSKPIPQASAAVTTIAPSIPIAMNNTSGQISNLGNVLLTSSSLNMNMPPPLAGLSHPFVPFTDIPSSVTSTTMSVTNLNSSSSNIISSITTTCANSQPTTDTHLLGDYVTSTMASAITDVICRGPPKLAPRPNGPLQSEGSIMYPSQAGPVSRTLVENAHKMTDFFITVIEDTINEMSMGENGVLQAKITLLTLELERVKQSYETQMAELKRTSDLMLCEMRKSMEMEKSRMANEIRKQCEVERMRSVEEAKKKQWCANCGREAQFYCCWNTSYCDYPCQQLHWSRHSAHCAQTRPNNCDKLSMSQERQKSQTLNKGPLNVGGMTVTSSQNKLIAGNKKDKHGNKNTGNMNSLPAEVLKLPSNTYLRPVQGGANCSTTSSSSRGNSQGLPMPIDHYNVPKNSNNPAPPFTVLRRNCWKVTGQQTSVNNTQTMSNNMPAPLASVLSQQQHAQLMNVSMSGGSMTNINPNNNSSANSNNGSNNNNNITNNQRNISVPGNSATLIPMSLAPNQVPTSLQCNVMRTAPM